MSNLPPQPTPFIGRAAELGEIGGLLADPQCRLITLAGPGGVGKTRLAAQAALRAQGNFANGAHFVPLQMAASTDSMLAALADALGLLPPGDREPLDHLLNWLHAKDLLLVLDNFEQLITATSMDSSLPGPALLLGELLTAAPGLKFLVTSREVLRLQEEWLFSVQGLPFPRAGFSDEAEAYGAVQLFAERARRVRRDFSLADERAGVIRVCQLVEGMPLALELAAIWARTFSAAAIADEIGRGLDFLATGLRNVPDRHRSMQTVFEHSWQLLGEPEREVLKRLSVFRGSFGRGAAGQVGGANRASLEALVDKSLLWPEPAGRYQMHELLRQFAAERLAESPNLAAGVRDTHCAYYTDFLAGQRNSIDGERQREVIAAISADLDNIRAAWGAAVQGLRLDDLQKSAYTWMDFFELQSRFREGAETFDRLAEALAQAPPGRQRDLLLAEALAYLGQECLRLGQLEKARAALERSRALYTGLDAEPLPGMGTDPLFALSVLAHVEGRVDEAVGLAEECRRLSEARGDRHNLALALYALSGAMFAKGQYEAAHRNAEGALAISQALGCGWFAAYCLIELGNVARAQGDYGRATANYQAAEGIRRELADPEGIAVALRQQGWVNILQKNYPQAQRLLAESLALYREIGDRGGLAAALEGLGHAALGLANHAAARGYFGEALRLLTEAGLTPSSLSTLVGVAELLWKTGQTRLSVELLALVGRHPASDRETKERAQRQLDRIPAGQASGPRRDGGRDPAADLDNLVTEVLTELAARPESAPVAATPGLADLLRERELEILRFIAEGLSNQEIAQRLVMSVGTIKWYTGQIYSKLAVRGRTQAIARARELKLLP